METRLREAERLWQADGDPLPLLKQLKKLGRPSVGFEEEEELELAKGYIVRAIVYSRRRKSLKLVILCDLAAIWFRLHPEFQSEGPIRSGNRSLKSFIGMTTAGELGVLKLEDIRAEGQMVECNVEGSQEPQAACRRLRHL